MMLIRMIVGVALGLPVALMTVVPSTAAPVPTLDGTWLVRGSSEGPVMALVSLGTEGNVTAVVPSGMLSLPDGSNWTVVSPGQGTWRSQRFPDGVMSLVFLTIGADAVTAPVLKLGVQMTLAQTGQQWTGTVWTDVLDGSGRTRASRAEVGTLTATRVLYGRP